MEDPSAAVRVVRVERISTVLVPSTIAVAMPESVVPVRRGRYAMASAVEVASAWWRDLGFLTAVLRRLGRSMARGGGGVGSTEEGEERGSSATAAA